MTPRALLGLPFAVYACHRPTDSAAAHPPDETTSSTTAVATAPIASASATESPDPNAPPVPWGREDSLSDPPPGPAATASVAVHRRAPTIRQEVTQVSGRLPPEVIQRIVRQNFGRFKLCYQDGLRRNPKLEGRIAIKFVIDAAGNVKTVDRDPSTTLGDAEMVACVKRVFPTLSFPAPEGGVVTVVYPLIFEPPTD